MRATQPVAFPEPAPTNEDVERMLIWFGGEMRAERTFAWYRARRPRAFITACPPSLD